MKTLLSWIYGLATFVRNLLYDEHVLHSYKPKLPTICVGNLAVGGTGKTPHVEYLVAMLLREGYRVAILSRGYKRRTKGFIVADETATADQIGDEPRQYQLKFPSAIIAVGEDRAKAIRRLCKRFPDLDVIVLDDAFQHRKVRCGFNILLTPFDRLYVHDHLLPRGRLRELPHGANRADMVVVSKCPDSMTPIERRVTTTALHCPTFQELCFSYIRYSDPVPLFPESGSRNSEQAACSPETFSHPLPAEVSSPFSLLPSTSPLGESEGVPSPSSPLRGLLLSGIAQPHYLRDYLADRVVAEMTFPDHHRFTKQDMDRLTAMLATLPSDTAVLTTEKDAARLRDSAIVPESIRPRIFYIPIAVDFGQDTDVFLRPVLRYVRENRRPLK